MNITFVDCENGDWTAMYVNGVKVTEGHSLSPWQILNALGIDYKCIVLKDEYVENGDGWTELLADLDPESIVQKD